MDGPRVSNPSRPPIQENPSAERDVPPWDSLTVKHSDLTNHQLGLQYLDTLRQWSGKDRFALDNIRPLAEALGNPQDRFKSVHIAGTNGKGSVSVMVSALLAEAGKNVGLTTSPHLVSHNERIVLNGHIISDPELGAVGLKIKEAAEQVGVRPSFHEAFTMAAFLKFTGLDYGVVEVGLGGRLDSSNIIKLPTVGAITTIGLDHEAILGARLTQIAKEKAGIIKSGMNVVVGRVDDDCFAVINERANEVGANLLRLGRDFDWEKAAHGYEFKCRPGESVAIKPVLQGSHQLDNIAVALKLASLLGVDSNDFQSGLNRAYWPGRFESVVFRGKELILDCAHNLPGVKAFAESLAERTDGKVDMLMGMTERANYMDLLEYIPRIADNVAVLKVPGPRGMDSALLSRQLSSLGVKTRDFGEDIEGCLDYLVKSNKSQIYCCGSIYLIGEIMRAIGHKPTRFW